MCRTNLLCLASRKTSKLHRSWLPLQKRTTYLFHHFENRDRFNKLRYDKTIPLKIVLPRTYVNLLYYHHTYLLKTRSGSLPSQNRRSIRIDCFRLFQLLKKIFNHTNGLNITRWALERLPSSPRPSRLLSFQKIWDKHSPSTHTILNFCLAL